MLVEELVSSTHGFSGAEVRVANNNKFMEGGGRGCLSIPLPPPSIDF